MNVMKTILRSVLSTTADLGVTLSLSPEIRYSPKRLSVPSTNRTNEMASWDNAKRFFEEQTETDWYIEHEQYTVNWWLHRRGTDNHVALITDAPTALTVIDALRDAERVAKVFA